MRRLREEHDGRGQCDPKIPATSIPYVDATGKVVYLTHEGHVLNVDGSLRVAPGASDSGGHGIGDGREIPSVALNHGVAVFTMRKTFAECMLERLFAIKWHDAEAFYKHEPSRVELMSEYLRRGALWANELGGTRKWPFFDIAERIAPSVQVPPELSAQLQTYIEQNIGGISTEYACHAALRWATLRDTHQKLPDLEDPFEPLITLYERGGEIIADETRAFDFGIQSVRVRAWREHLSSEPCTSLDPAALDALDAEKAYRRNGIWRTT
ncbi:hypothetical protein AB0L85_02835 [Streptomyces sp. NPDC052051]|uniref:hypothetical protein n=1 Tax=Streptomyces sp. NPDC052051 TaxID=3154649 RepID=UPI00342F81AF